MTDDRFAAYTRSASFALTLSQAQITRLLHHDTVEKLRDTYPWYEPFPLNFDTGENHAIRASDSTIRALARKGLVDVTPIDPPTSHYDIVRLSEAGRVMAELLRLAGFTIEPRQVPPVPLHPDDRIVVALDGSDPTVPNDRRWPAPEEFAPFLSGLRAPAYKEAP